MALISPTPHGIAQITLADGRGWSGNVRANLGFNQWYATIEPNQMIARTNATASLIDNYASLVGMCHELRRNSAKGVRITLPAEATATFYGALDTWTAPTFTKLPAHTPDYSGFRVIVRVHITRGELSVDVESHANTVSGMPYLLKNSGDGAGLIDTLESLRYQYRIMEGT